MTRRARTPAASVLARRARLEAVAVGYLPADDAPAPADAPVVPPESAVAAPDDAEVAA